MKIMMPVVAVLGASLQLAEGAVPPSDAIRATGVLRGSPAGRRSPGLVARTLTGIADWMGGSGALEHIPGDDMPVYSSADRKRWKAEAAEMHRKLYGPREPAPGVVARVANGVTDWLSGTAKPIPFDDMPTHTPSKSGWFR